ncbi:MAG: EF-P beta-lysylation protein EpmB [Planctomycetaceae bacterium]
MSSVGRDVNDETAFWKRELAEAIRDPAELVRLLRLPEQLGVVARTATAGFPFLVPRGFVARMRQGDPKDPLLRQVLPVAAEQDEVAGWTADPLGEQSKQLAPGMIRKYRGRALLLVTPGCAVNCRYCFRREFPHDEAATTHEWEAPLEALSTAADIDEVILSGGDPLLVDDRRLERLVSRLEERSHVRRLRIHSRLPIVLPERVTNGLVSMIRGTRLSTIIVVHANHPAEIDASVERAVARLADSRATVLNQSVLLAGVNDTVEVLTELSLKLIAIGILPYYLHLPDRVRGTAHFDVPEHRARVIHAALRDVLPGYAVPRLVREVPGDASKRWIG